MDVAMALDAQCLQVGWVEAYLLHLLWCPCALDRNLVVYVDGTSHISISLAYLAEWVLL
jgi:hypothetical protein